MYDGDLRAGHKNISPCKGLRRLGISRGVQGTSIAVGVRYPRKSKPLNKSCKYTFSYTFSYKRCLTRPPIYVIMKIWRGRGRTQNQERLEIMKYLVNKNACYIITCDEIDVQRLQDRECMFFLTEHDMCRHASIACGLDMEDVRGSAIFIGTDDDFQENVIGIEILEEDADILTFIECYDY